MNRLILGDNLEVMKTLESESVDLIYLDPPFFSNRQYEIIWGPEALLERIIRCASNEGDIVLDPFMGGGTLLPLQNGSVGNSSASANRRYPLK